MHLAATKKMREENINPNLFKGKGIIWSIARIFTVIIIFYFLGSSLYRNWEQLYLMQLHFNIPLILLSILFLWANFLLSVQGWKLILKNLTISLPFLKGLKVFFYSELWKYLPGKVWSFAGRMYLCQKLGISSTKTFVSMVMQVALTTISGILIFLISLVFNSKFRTYVNPLILLIIVISVLTILHPKILTRIINVFLHLLKKGSIRIEVSFSQICVMLGYYCVVWLFFGTAFYFLINSVTFIPASKIPILAGLFCISATIGVAALFAPAGLGVRESVLAVLLSNFFPISLSILISVLSRIWVSVIELVMVGISTRIRL